MANTVTVKTFRFLTTGSAASAEREPEKDTIVSFRFASAATWHTAKRRLAKLCKPV
jgi:hypothetical protein